MPVRNLVQPTENSEMFESLASCFAFRRSAPLNIDRGIGFGLGLFALGTPACRVWSTSHLVEFKNDFATAFPLSRMCNCGFDFA